MRDAGGVGVSRPSGDPIEGLLLELCERGYCDALRALDRAAAADMTIDELTDAVLQAEGLEPTLVSRPHRRGVRNVLVRWIST